MAALLFGTPVRKTRVCSSTVAVRHAAKEKQVQVRSACFFKVSIKAQGFYAPALAGHAG
ncbi:putative lysine-specific histone demethylase [Acetobacter orientalis]|uniref:Putative lysine-specific histone demethylase n=1 Tax=Acetobacter orientalis TaxID=146474 RepID=A0A2Z5ZHR1_9PROT|nr:putative lysine-specific histone demethylase [Acetobacter orientalis]